MGDPGTKVSYWTTLLRRVLSIYPLHVVALFLGAFAVDFSNVNSWSFVENLLLVQAWHADGLPVGEPWNHVNWFLSTLFLFYIAFDLIFAVVQRLPQQRLLAALSLCWIWSLHAQLWSVSFKLNPWDNVDTTSVLFKQYCYTNALTHYQCFVFGVVLARVAAGPPWPGSRPGCATFSISLLMVLIATVGPWSAYLAIWNGLLLPLHGLIVLGIAWHQAHDPIGRLFGDPWVEMLGELAFPMYILHIVVLRFYQRYFRAEFPPQGALYPIFVVLAAAVGVLSVQRPCAWLTRRLLKSSSVNLEKDGKAIDEPPCAWK